MNTPTTNFNVKAFIPIALFAILIIIFDVWKVYPKTVEWIETKTDLQEFTDKLEKNSALLKTNQKKETELQTQLDAESKESILEESLLFPETFDAYYVTKTLEVFSVQYSQLTTTSALSIERLSFSEGSKNGKTLLTMDLTCSEETLKSVIEYLQSGELPEGIEPKDNYFEREDVTYLETHKLPIAHIESINIAESSTSNIYKHITLKVAFFTQK